MTIECTVKFNAGSYITSTVRGKRCSCSHSPEEAVRRLGVKLFGSGLLHVERLPPQPGDNTAWQTRWRIVSKVT